MSSLSRNPQKINLYTWYYEEPRGICIIHQIHEMKSDGSIGKYLRTDQFTIPWGKLKTSLKRKENKSKAENMKT